MEARGARQSAGLFGKEVRRSAGPIWKVHGSIKERACLPSLGADRQTKFVGTFGQVDWVVCRRRRSEGRNPSNLMLVVLRYVFGEAAASIVRGVDDSKELVGCLDGCSPVGCHERP